MAARILLGNFSAVRGPVLVRVDVVLVLVLLRLQGDRLSSGGSCPLAAGLLGRGGRMGGAFCFRGASVGVVFLLRGRREVRALLSATGPCRYSNVVQCDQLSLQT